MGNGGRWEEEGERMECTRAILGPRMCEDLRATKLADHLPITYSGES